MDASDSEEQREVIPNNNDVDATTRRDTRRPYEKQLAVHFILASIFFECVAFYALENNLAYNLKLNTTFNWTTSYSSKAASIFEVTNLFSMIIFAIISDAIISRAKTISFGFPLYLIGFTFLTIFAKGKTSLCDCSKFKNLTARSIFDEPCAKQLIPILVFTAIGSGAVRSNMIAFGADQIPYTTVVSRYLDKFVVAINLGSISETLITSYLRDSSEPGFTIYTVAVSVLFLSAFLFFIGWRYYIHVEPYKSVITKTIPVTINAFQRWHQYKRKQRNIERQNRNVNILYTPDASTNFDNIEIEESIRRSERPSTFLDFAKRVHNGKSDDWIVDEVKSFRNAIIILILVFPYRLVFTQLYTTFVSQAMQMNRPDSIKVVYLLLISEPMTIIVGILILNLFVYQYLRARNRSLTIARKFVISMCFSFLTMLITGGVEIVRQHYCPQNSLAQGKSDKRSNLTMYAQLPQDISIGIAQLFGLLASFEFAYFVAPSSAQSLFMSLHYISRVLASYVGYAYTNLLSKHSLDLNFSCTTDGTYLHHNFNYFFIFAAVQFIFIIIFIICQKKIRMIKLNRQKVETNQLVQHIPNRAVH